MKIPQRSKLSVIVTATLVACSAVNSDDESEQELSAEPAPEIVGEAGAPASPALGPGMQRLVDHALEDLQTRFGVGKDDVKISSAEFVTWPDTSAGCPRPDMQYLQVLVNGSRIVLKTAERTYQYHSGGNRPPFYCPDPEKREPLPYQHGET